MNNPFSDNLDSDATLSTAVPPPLKNAVNQASPHIFSNDDDIEQAFMNGAINPIIGVGAPLLWFISQISNANQPGDIAGLKTHILTEIRRFETVSLGLGFNSVHVRLAKFTLCAAIDDLVLNTDWGMNSIWSSNSLMSLVYKETDSGSKFFEIMDFICKDVDNYIDIIELMLLCIIFGFTGKFRIIIGGDNQLSELRNNIYAIIRRHRPPYETNLSISWQNIPLAHKPVPSSRPALWLAAGCLTLLIITYASLSLFLRSDSDVIIARLNDLTRHIDKINVPISADPFSNMPKELPKPVNNTDLLTRLATALKPFSNELRLAEANDIVRIRIIDPEFFSPGKVLVNPIALHILTAIAAAIDHENIRIEIVGHADNTPTNPQAKMNNQILSELRAKSVAGRLMQYLTVKKTISTRGVGDNQPVDSNASARGRAENRQADIILYQINKNEK